MLPLESQNEYRLRFRAIHDGWRPSGEIYESTARDHLASDSLLLDLGCGRGGLAEKMAVENRAVFGLDSDWLSLVEYRGDAVRLISGVAERLPCVGKSFDLVIAAWLFEHLPEPAAVLCEVRRVLRPGGHCIFLTPNAAHPLVVVARMAQLVGGLQSMMVGALYSREARDIFRVYYRANSVRRLRSLSRQSGLRLINLQVVSDPTYLAFTEVTFRLSMLLEAMLPAGRGVHLVGLLQRP